MKELKYLNLSSNIIQVCLFIYFLLSTLGGQISILRVYSIILLRVYKSQKNWQLSFISSFPDKGNTWEPPSKIFSCFFKKCPELKFVIPFNEFAYNLKNTYSVWEETRIRINRNKKNSKSLTLFQLWPALKLVFISSILNSHVITKID